MLHPPKELAKVVQREHLRERLVGFRHPIIFHHFELLECIGRGGMGEVYRAKDQILNRELAIKLIRRDQDEHPQAQERLLREAQAMAQVDHPNVVRVYEAGMAEGRLYIAMDYIRGTSLRVWTEKYKPGRVLLLNIFIQAAHGLAAIHKVGLVHRDFKPDILYRLII